MNKKIIAVAITAILLSTLSLAWAEDYPAGFLNPGYRDYLGQKKQDGYYVDIFTHIDLRQKERVNKRNQVEEILGYSYQVGPVSSNGILSTQYQHIYNTSDLKMDIAKQRNEREKVASVHVKGGFTYIPHSDGKIEYFKDGLVTRVVNERVTDEFGNVSIRNTHNMKYNAKRLLVSYDATLADSRGNVTKLSWYGATYSSDSVFYGTSKTNANKHITEYYLKEIDPAGNERVTHWQAGSYEGKFLRAFSQTIEDTIYGKSSFTRSNIRYGDGDPNQATSYHEEGIGTDNLAYTLDRTDITYNGKGQLTGYHEEIIVTQIDGRKVKTTVDAQFEYLETAHKFGADVDPEPDKLLKTIVTSTTENPDGSSRTETATTSYTYDANGQLIGASAQSQFSGQEAKWYEYTDAAGHLLSRKVDKDGVVTYSYVDPDSLETVTVAEGQVRSTLKDGHKYNGTAETQFEILEGRPMAKQSHSLTSYYSCEDNSLLRIDDSTTTYHNALVNNLYKTLESQEHTVSNSPLLDPDGIYSTERNIKTTYIYDSKGNLIDAKGEGTASGWEYSSEKGWYGEYTSAISVDYEVILGKALLTYYEEVKSYIKNN